LKNKLKNMNKEEIEIQEEDKFLIHLLNNQNNE